MPTLSLKIAPAISRERHLALAESLTALTARTLGKRPEVTAVVIDEPAAVGWYVGSSPVSRPTALLEISITAGTNSAEQKAAFVEGAFALLQQQLAGDGRLEEASYVIVREVAAGDWGYGGVTQQARTGPAVPPSRTAPCAPLTTV